MGGEVGRRADVHQSIIHMAATEAACLAQEGAEDGFEKAAEGWRRWELDSRKWNSVARP